MMNFRFSGTFFFGLIVGCCVKFGKKELIVHVGANGRFS